MSAPDPFEERSRPGAYVRWEDGERVIVGEESSADPDAAVGPAPSDERRPGASVEHRGDAVVHVGHERADEIGRGPMITLLPDMGDGG